HNVRSLFFVYKSITNFVSKFNIRLVEPSSMKDVVLPKDGKDGLIIEMILIAY
ncbi:hypothetical protein TVAGG3_0879900, partial [Trichomonas vaginalis G3]|uniref:hypothetical protein n=1 Tax=Trichomonas vaginalis (strain ATCC PRA-98 / G3) TaxID=412133 RepID=UPI0021E5BEF6